MSTETDTPVMSMEDAVDRLVERQAPTSDEPAEQAQEPDPSEAVTEEPEASKEAEATEEAPEAAAEDTGEPDIPEVEADAEVEDEAEPADPAELYEVTVNGQTYEVTREELVKGYQLESDYRQKTAQIAEQRKQLEQMQLQYEAVLAQVAQSPEEPNWVEMQQNDPYWYEKKAEWDLQQGQRLQAQQALSEHQRQRAAAMAQEGAAKVIEAFPQWKDEKVRQRDLSEMKSAAKEMGFTEEEFAQTLDPRMFTLVYEAAQYRKSKAAKLPTPEPRPKPKVMKPEAKKTVTKAQKASDELRTQKRKLRQSGSFDDAVELLLMGNRGRGTTS